MSVELGDQAKIADYLNAIGRLAAAWVIGRQQPACSVPQLRSTTPSGSSSFQIIVGSTNTR